MDSVFQKIIIEHRLYEATKKDMNELKNWPDPDVVRDYELFYPIFRDIQKEKEESITFTGEIIIRQATMKDKEKIIKLSNRIFYGEKYEGIKRITNEDLFIYLNNGKVFVATTKTGYIVGVHIIRIGDINGKPCGWEELIIVSRCFRRKGIGKKLFNNLINWAKEKGLSHINTRGLTKDGFEFFKSMKKERTDLKININRFGISSIIF